MTTQVIPCSLCNSYHEVGPCPPEKPTEQEGRWNQMSTGKCQACMNIEELEKARARIIELESKLADAEKRATENHQWCNAPSKEAPNMLCRLSANHGGLFHANNMMVWVR